MRLPNQKVFTANITKFISNVARRFEYVFGIRYSDDVAQAIKIIKDLIEAQPMALKNQVPKVFADNRGMTRSTSLSGSGDGSPNGLGLKLSFYVR